MSSDANLERLFERRQRNVGKPLRSPVRPGPPVPDTNTGEEAGPPPLPGIDAPTAGSPAPEPAVVAPAAPEDASRRGTPHAAEASASRLVGPEPVGRYSIFLTREQVRWLKAVRGRLLVEGRDLSASQIVRLALGRLREAKLSDDELYRIAQEDAEHVRGRGRPAAGPA